MNISGFQKTTLLDYPEHLAATIFISGCNFRCPFCHNGGLVQTVPKHFISEEEIFSYLKKRHGILEGVCISGGEPTLEKELPQFILKIKNLGLKVKLDTNGYRPDVLAALLKSGLLDYVAMDIKSAPDSYSKLCGLRQVDIGKLQASVAKILKSNIPHEFRTTVVQELHTEQDFKSISKWISGCNAYFLQPYQDSPNVLHKGFHTPSKESMERYLFILKDKIPTAAIRGMD